MAKYKIFFGTYSKNIFYGEFDGETGDLKITGKSTEIENPSYLQFNPSNSNILYAVSEMQDGEIFSVDLQYNKITSVQKTNGAHPCHLCVKDNYVFVANYSGGSLSIFDIDESGNIKPSYQSIHHFGRSVNQGRQKQSHIHFAAMSPGNVYLAVCDLGMDKVFLYPYSKENGLSTTAKIIDCPPGVGPRHLTFSNDGKFMYVLTELANTVLVYEYGCYSECGIEYLSEMPTLPPDFKGSSTAAAIHMSPDGKYLAASNRGHDSIVLFNFPNDNKFTFSHIENCIEPRDFRFSPDSKWLLSANQNDDSVTVFKIENNTFNKTGSISMPKPVCVLFGDEI